VLDITAANSVATSFVNHHLYGGRACKAIAA